MASSCGLSTCIKVVNCEYHIPIRLPLSNVLHSAKYPLAIVAKAMKVLGPRTSCGYDIGCSFLATVLASSLADAFKASKSRLCVDAFHGYSHNYACQSVHHPNIIEGAGLEDYGTMERIFSASNSVALVTRYASAWNRRVFIDMFFRQWDEDKYVNIGTMLLNNYCQALEILAGEPALIELMRTMNVDRNVLDQWQKEESTYVLTLGQESPYDVHHMAYVEALQQLRAAQYVLSCKIYARAADSINNL